MSLPPIIGLNGVARSGKDTVADILNKLYGYESASFSDTLNKALINLNPLVPFSYEAELPGGSPVTIADHIRYADYVDKNGYEQAKENPEVRRLLQAMGTEVGRNLLGEDIWVEALFKNIPEGQLTAIVNVRFPNEYDAVKSRGGVVWRVERPGYEAALGHISDTALDEHEFDVTFYNNGTIEQLAQNVVRYLDGAVQRSFA